MLLAYVTDYVGWKFNEHGAGQNKFFAFKNLQRKDIFFSEKKVISAKIRSWLIISSDI